MNWSIIKTFPKYAIVIGVFVISTGLFGVWWYFGHSKPKVSEVKPAPAKQPVQNENAKSLPEKLGYLALVGADLYDISNGELLFPNWLRGIPKRVFYYPGSKHLVVQAERGVMRFGLDGKQDGVMGVDTPPAFTNDGKIAMFVKDGDIWIADVDWTAFNYVNERQATRYGQFYAPYFSANLPLASEKACLVNQNQPLRVDLLTGDLKPINLHIGTNAKRRSPDCKVMMGEADNNIFAFDVDQPEASLFPRSGGKVSDFQWLSNDTCAMIVGGKSVSVYDRKKNSVEEVAELPFPCSKITDPSPDGRYALCTGSKGIALIDTEQKKADPLEILANHIWWVSNDTLIYSVEIPDMKARGTWLKTLGSEAQQVMAEPYLVGWDKSAALAVLKELNYVLFATKNAVFKMKPDGSELMGIIKLRNPVPRIQPIVIWGN